MRMNCWNVFWINIIALCRHTLQIVDKLRIRSSPATPIVGHTEIDRYKMIKISFQARFRHASSVRETFLWPVCKVLFFKKNEVDLGWCTGDNNFLISHRRYRYTYGLGIPHCNRQIHMLNKQSCLYYVLV
jgi:hypothetical protein